MKRAEPPRLLEYTWGGSEMRWELEPLGDGTRLTLWHNIDRHYIAMGAAGWHICFDVLDRFLAGDPIGRIVGVEAMKFDGWQRLQREYAQAVRKALKEVQVSSWIRQIHRWVAIIFTVTVIANFIALARGTPPAWITYSPLAPLAFLLFTGLYMFALPYAVKWREGRTA